VEASLIYWEGDDRTVSLALAIKNQPNEVSSTASKPPQELFVLSTSKKPISSARRCGTPPVGREPHGAADQHPRVGPRRRNRRGTGRCAGSVQTGGRPLKEYLAAIARLRKYSAEPRLPWVVNTGLRTVPYPTGLAALHAAMRCSMNRRSIALRANVSAARKCSRASSCLPLRNSNSPSAAW
jgi:hypothetical protein